MRESKNPNWIAVLDMMVGEELRKRGFMKKQRWKRVTRTGSWPSYVFRLGLSTRPSVFRNENDICIRKQYPTEVDSRVVNPPVYMSDDSSPLIVFPSPVGDVRKVQVGVEHPGLKPVVEYIVSTLLETPDVGSLYSTYGVPDKKIKLSLNPDFKRNIFFGGFVTGFEQDGSRCKFLVNSQTVPGDKRLVEVDMNETLEDGTPPIHIWDEGCMYYAEGLNGGGDVVRVWLSEDQFAAYYEAV